MQDMWIETDERNSFYDTRAFKEYAAMIKKIIFSSAARQKKTTGEITGVTTRFIHETLGHEAHYEWTQDAIESLRDVEGVGLQPTKYRPKQK